MCFGFHGVSIQSLSNNFCFTVNIGQSEEIMGIVNFIFIVPCIVTLY